MFVLVEDPAQTLPSSDVQVDDLVWFGDRWRQRLQRAGVGDALMRPMLVVEGLELAVCVEQVPLVPDQRAVEELTAVGLHPPLHHRIHPRHPRPGQHRLDTGIGQNGVEQLRELAVPVADQEPCPAAGVF